VTAQIPRAVAAGAGGHKGARLPWWEFKIMFNASATLGVFRLSSQNGCDQTDRVAVHNPEKPRLPGAALNLAARRATFSRGAK
jgi:hypothetical protein